jgi:hypothetical protein
VRRGKLDPRRLARILPAVALTELTVLYLAVGDMVIKPVSSDTATLATGGAILAVSVLVSLAIALWPWHASEKAEIRTATVADENELGRAARA